MRRFVMHVLPRGFMKIRHYGLLSSRQREKRLHLSRQLLLAISVMLLPAPTSSTVKPAERPHCARCGGERFTRQMLEKPSVDSPEPQAETTHHERGHNTS